MNGFLFRDLLSNRLLRLATIGLLTAVLCAAAASAQDQCDECSMCDSCLNCCHEPPEMWMVYTRHMPRCSNLDEGFERICIKRYDCQCRRFVKSSVEEFIAEEATMPTLFYLHGNTLKHKGAMKGFWDIYHRLRCCPGKKRLVCWSWPAQRVFKTRGLRIREMIRKNLRIKYVYAEYQGYYLAKLVQKMSLTQRVMLSGHSYGAISAAAALHWMGGGELRGLTLEGGEPVERPNLRAAMISGAFDNDMLYPGHRYGQAFVTGEKIFVTRNCHDKTLRKWPKTSWRGRQAIGLTGMRASCLGQYRDKLCQQTTYPENGRSHYLGPHLKNARFVSALCCLSFGNCESCGKGEPAEEKAEALQTEESAVVSAEEEVPQAKTNDKEQLELVSPKPNEEVSSGETAKQEEAVEETILEQEAA